MQVPTEEALTKIATPIGTVLARTITTALKEVIDYGFSLDQKKRSEDTDDAKKADRKARYIVERLEEVRMECVHVQSKIDLLTSESPEAYKLKELREKLSDIHHEETKLSKGICTSIPYDYPG